jgi:hypothetical protein
MHAVAARPEFDDALVATTGPEDPQAARARTHPALAAMANERRVTTVRVLRIGP